MNPVFEFDAKLWQWEAKSGPGWMFVTVPQDHSDQIKEMTPLRNGFGSVKVNVQIGDSEWSTSIFPSTEEEAFVLPIKKAIRLAEDIGEGDSARISLEALIT